MEITYSKYRKALEGHKMPRKLKKFILGRKKSKKEIRELIKRSKVESDDGYNVYIIPFSFCPNCGCEKTRCTDYGVSYPEIWIEDYCARCDSYVGGADNSRYYHVLEDLIV